MTGREKRIRVVFLIGQLEFGGTERQLFLLLQQFDLERFEPVVVVVNSSTAATYHAAIEALGIQVMTLPVDCQSIMQRCLYLYRLFRKLSPQVVHSWTVHDNPYAGLVGWLAGVPLRWGSLRGSTRLQGFHHLPASYRWLSLYGVSTLTVNARALRQELVADGYPARKVRLLPNCVEARVSAKVEPDLTSFGIRDGDRLIGCVGNLRGNKNHALMIQVMGSLASDYPDLRALIVGQPAQDEEGLPGLLEGQIHALNLQEQVFLTGFRDDVPSLLTRFSILCHTSQSEGLPNVVLEAMAAARPVVATRVGGVPEVVHDGINGFLVAPGDVDGFASAVKKLLDDPALAEKMGRAGREIVEKEYGCQDAARRLAGFYHQALVRKGLSLPEAQAA